MDLLIVIVNFNRADFLGHCLTAALAEIERSGHTGRIVVVDNASTDESVEVVRGFPDVHLIQNEQNRGFAAGCNQGGKAFPSRYVLLLNNDVELQKDSLRPLLAHAEADPRLGAVGAKLLTPEGIEQRPAIPWGGRKKHRQGQPVPIDWLPGACLLLRREALDRIGWLDEGFFFYNEDLDLGLRLRKAKYRLHYLPESAVIHHEGKSSDLVRPLAILEGYRGGLRLTAKHYGPIAFRLARWGMKLERAWRDRRIQRKEKRDQSLSPKEKAWQEISPEVGKLLRDYRYGK